MCNCKGWDVAYYPEYMTVQPHFCRVLDDCGHADNTLEDAAAKVAADYQREYESFLEYTSQENTRDDKYVQFLLSEIDGWKNLTHRTYLFYKEQENE